MNRGDVYKLIARSLEQYRASNFGEIAAVAGTTVSEIRTRVGEEAISLEVGIEWTDGSCRAMRIEVTAYGPSCWMTDRMSESIIISKPTK